jgi:hypothetical protein
MDKVTALLIRACKSNSTEYRLKRIYKSAYYGKYDCRHMLNILLNIAESYQLTSLRKLVIELDPANAWKYGGKESDLYEERACKALISVIRLTAVVKFEGLPVPRRFKEK